MADTPIQIGAGTTGSPRRGRMIPLSEFLRGGVAVPVEPGPDMKAPTVSPPSTVVAAPLADRERLWRESLASLDAPTGAA